MTDFNDLIRSRLTPDDDAVEVEVDDGVQRDIDLDAGKGEGGHTTSFNDVLRAIRDSRDGLDA